MTTLITKSCTTGLLILGLLGLCPIDPALAQVGLPKRPAEKPKAAPMVLIAVTDKYQSKDLQPLKHAVESAISLSAAFNQIGYEVRFLTGSESVETVKKATKRPVSEANDGKKLGDEIKAWMKQVARQKPPIAFVILSGHGEQRENVAYLLGRNDSPGDGGVSVKDLRETAAADSLRLVLVYDACRVNRKPVIDIVDDKGKKVDAPVIKPGADQLPASQRWDKRDEVLRISPPPTGGALPTVVYSTRAGDVASDKEDFISHLARGLRYDDETKNYLAIAHPDLRTARDLSLYHWFYFGAAAQLRSSKLKQSLEIVLGAVALDTPVASLQKGQLKAPPEPFEMVPLLTRWEPQWGGYESSFDTRSGYRITHPLGAVKRGEWYRAGKLGGDTGFDVAGGRLLSMDVVATYEGRANQPRSFSCEIHAAHREPGSTDRFFMCRNTHPYSFPYNQVMSIKIPVNPLPPGRNGEARLLNFLAFACLPSAPGFWPPNATITVLDLKIEPRPEGMPVNSLPSVQPKSANLLAVWAGLNPVPDGSPLLRYAHDRKLGLTLQPEAAKGTAKWSKCGGDLSSAIYIPKGSQLEVDVGNSSSSEAELVLDVANIQVEKEGKVVGTSFVEPGSIKVRPGSAKLKVPVTREGYIHYLAVGTNSAAINLKSVKVLPRPSK